MKKNNHWLSTCKLSFLDVARTCPILNTNYTIQTFSFEQKLIIMNKINFQVSTCSNIISNNSHVMGM
jgi:hypothetical protein